MSTADTLQSLRVEIDRIDDSIVDLLAERLGIVRRVVEVKRREGLPALIPARVDEVLAHVREHAIAQGLPPELAEMVWQGVIDWTIKYEESQLSFKQKV